MSAPTPDDIRIAWFLGAPRRAVPLEQRDQFRGHLIRIMPRTLTVNYWHPTARSLEAGTPRWYVSIEGRIVRRADDSLSRRDARVAYWPEHASLGHDIASAPEWVQQLVTQAHLIVLGPSA